MQLKNDDNESREPDASEKLQRLHREGPEVVAMCRDRNLVMTQPGFRGVTFRERPGTSEVFLSGGRSY